MVAISSGVGAALISLSRLGSATMSTQAESVAGLVHAARGAWRRLARAVAAGDRAEALDSWLTEVGDMDGQSSIHEIFVNYLK